MIPGVAHLGVVEMLPGKFFYRFEQVVISLSVGFSSIRQFTFFRYWVIFFGSFPF
jgi:hypothetical protein